MTKDDADLYASINAAEIIIWIRREYGGDYEPQPFASREEALKWFLEELPAIHLAAPAIITPGPLSVGFV